MYKSAFGKFGQVSFNSEAEYYELLGYLAKNDGSTRIIWEHNEDQGAWASEGRILFYKKPPVSLAATLNYTAGVGNIDSRVNCNDFIGTIVEFNDFVTGTSQNAGNIRVTVPVKYQADFDRGYSM